MNRVQRPSYLRLYCVCCDVAHASLRSRRNFKLKVPARMDHVLMFMYLVVGRQAVHFELPRRRRSFPSSSASNLRGIKYFADTYVFADLSDPLKRELVVIRTGYCAKPPSGRRSYSAMDYEALKESWSEVEDRDGVRLSWNVFPSSRMVRLSRYLDRGHLLTTL